MSRDAIIAIECLSEGSGIGFKLHKAVPAVMSGREWSFYASQEIINTLRPCIREEITSFWSTPIPSNLFLSHKVFWYYVLG